MAAVKMARVFCDQSEMHDDVVAVEEPLEIRLGCDVAGRRVHRAVSITMRTPGHDLELAVGFLFTEGIIAAREQVAGVAACGAGNVACVNLRPATDVDLSRLERHFYATSSCGVCGKLAIGALEIHPARPIRQPGPRFPSELIYRLPELLRQTQNAFDLTGGLHAAALFSPEGTLLGLREDVGRHNAVDKLIGFALRDGTVPLGDSLILVSGRAGFELVQKSIMASIPILAAVGAPSSLAVELANRFGMTLVGFLRGQRFNIYSGAGRIA